MEEIAYNAIFLHLGYLIQSDFFFLSSWLVSLVAIFSSTF